jgi:hypothetical protein
MVELLKTLEMGNRATGFRMVTHFYGIVGFVRFLEGYYLIIIKRKSPVAYVFSLITRLIGGHCIYHIDDTQKIYIPGPLTKKENKAEESR